MQGSRKYYFYDTRFKIVSRRKVVYLASNGVVQQAFAVKAIEQLMEKYVS